MVSVASYILMVPKFFLCSDLNSFEFHACVSHCTLDISTWIPLPTGPSKMHPEQTPLLLFQPSHFSYDLFGLVWFFSFWLMSPGPIQSQKFGGHLRFLIPPLTYLIVF